MRTLLAALFVALPALADEAEKPVLISDADLAVLADMRHPKYADTVSRLDGKLVRLAGRVTHGRGGTGDAPVDPKKTDTLRLPAGRDRTLAVRLHWADDPAAEKARKDVLKADSKGVSLTVYGRVRVAKATNSADEEVVFFGGLKDVTTDPKAAK